MISCSSRQCVGEQTSRCNLENTWNTKGKKSALSKGRKLRPRPNIVVEYSGTQHAKNYPLLWPTHTECPEVTTAGGDCASRKLLSSLPTKAHAISLIYNRWIDLFSEKYLVLLTLSGKNNLSLDNKNHVSLSFGCFLPHPHGFVEPNQPSLDLIGLDWPRLVEIGPDWFRLDQIASDWAWLVQISRNSTLYNYFYCNAWRRKSRVLDDSRRGALNPQGYFPRGVCFVT